MNIRTKLAAVVLAAGAALGVSGGVATAAPASTAAEACQWDLVGATLPNLWAWVCVDRSGTSVAGDVTIQNNTGQGVWVNPDMRTTVGNWTGPLGWVWLNPNQFGVWSTNFKVDPTPATKDRTEAKVWYNTAAIGTKFDHVYSPWG